MKKSTRYGSAAMVAAILIAAAILTFPAMVAAQSKAIEGVKFEVSQSLNDNLKPLVGKNVCVALRSGKTYLGSLKAVGDHFIHLEKIAEKNFFDALIRIEDISAIEVQFRDNK
jgi:small nuclear ribonucleoprotein (snRNP)-like protein